MSRARYAAMLVDDFYDMPEGRIRSVRSLLDEGAIERQMSAPRE